MEELEHEADNKFSEFEIAYNKYLSEQSVIDSVKSLVESLDATSDDDVNDAVVTLEALGIFDGHDMMVSEVMELPVDDKYALLCESTEVLVLTSIFSVVGLIALLVAAIVAFIAILEALFGSNGDGGSDKGGKDKGLTRKIEIEISSSTKTCPKFTSDTVVPASIKMVVENSDGTKIVRINEEYSKWYDKYKDDLLSTHTRFEDIKDLSDKSFWHDIINIMGNENIDATDAHLVSEAMTKRVWKIIYDHCDDIFSSDRVFPSGPEAFKSKLHIQPVEGLVEINTILDALKKDMSDLVNTRDTMLSEFKVAGTIDSKKALSWSEAVKYLSNETDASISSITDSTVLNDIKRYEAQGVELELYNDFSNTVQSRDVDKLFPIFKLYKLLMKKDKSIRDILIEWRGSNNTAKILNKLHTTSKELLESTKDDTLGYNRYLKRFKEAADKIRGKHSNPTSPVLNYIELVNLTSSKTVALLKERIKYIRPVLNGFGKMVNRYNTTISSDATIKNVKIKKFIKLREQLDMLNKTCNENWKNAPVVI